MNDQLRIDLLRIAEEIRTQPAVDHGPVVEEVECEDDYLRVTFADGFTVWFPPALRELRKANP